MEKMKTKSFVLLAVAILTGATLLGFAMNVSQWHPTPPTVPPTDANPEPFYVYEDRFTLSNVTWYLSGPNNYVQLYITNEQTYRNDTPTNSPIATTYFNMTAETYHTDMGMRIVVAHNETVLTMKIYLCEEPEGSCLNIGPQIGEIYTLTVESEHGSSTISSKVS